MGILKSNSEFQIKNVKFKNPILAASGTYGYAKEFERFYDIHQLGGIVTKTITVKPRIGNPPGRVIETPAGMLNAIGLQNVGVEKFISDKLPYLKSLKIPIIVSVMGYSIDEFKEVVNLLDKRKEIDGFELNMSCPNVTYGTLEKPVSGERLEVSEKGFSNRQPETGNRKPKMFAHDANMIQAVVQAARKTTDKMIWAKLGPDVSDIGAMGMAAERGGADAISLINTVGAMAIDIKTKKT